MNRREFIQLACGTGLGCMGLGCSAGAALSGGAKKPNVLLILADDLGWSDLGMQLLLLTGFTGLSGF